MKKTKLLYSNKKNIEEKGNELNVQWVRKKDGDAFSIPIYRFHLLERKSINDIVEQPQ